MLSVVENFGTGKLEIAEIPSPAAKSGFVLVANRASLVSSGTERATIELAQKSLLGKALARRDLVKQVLGKLRRDGLGATIASVRARLDTPMQLGYSSAGVVVEAGGNVAEFAPGDRVACAGARYATHSQFVCVPKNLCVRIPDGVSFEDASYVTLGAIAMHGVRQSRLSLGESAAVIGCGLIGLITVQILSAAGVKVFAIDLDATKLDLAKKLSGASGCPADSPDLARLALDFTGGAGFDAVLVTAATPSSEPVRLAAVIARDRGRVVIVGDVGLDIRRRAFYDKELTLVVSRSYGPGRYDPNYEERGVEYPLGYVRWGERRNLAEFLALIASGKVNVKTLTTHSFEIADAMSAYNIVLGKTAAPHIGIVLKYPSGKSPDRRIKLEPARPPVASPEIGLAFVGAGAFATSVLLPAATRAPSVTPVAVVSAGGLSARHAGDKFGFEYAASDFDAVLSDSRVNCVVIATRHNLHASQAATALAAGKHVFVEKPLAIDRSGLDKVAAAYAGAGRVLMVGFNRRWSAQAAAAKALFAGASRPLTINYRVNAGTLPAGNWVLDAEEGGGRVLGEVCHFIDLATFFTGALPRTVFAVRAGGSSALSEDAESVVVTLRFADGSVAAITYASAGEPSFSKERIEVSGSGRTAVIEDFRRTTLYSESGSRVLKTAQDKGHAAEMAAFFDAVRSGRMSVPFEEIRAVTAATLAVEESLRTGAPVSL